MKESKGSEMTRRDLLKTVAGAAAIAGAAGLGISPAKSQPAAAIDQADVITLKGREGCDVPKPAPGVEVIDGMHIDRDVAIKMRDGVTIYADIYRPEGGRDIPAIFAAGAGKQPREVERRGVAQGTGWGMIKVSKYAKMEGPDPVWWCKQGYAVVNPEARGANNSGGIGQLYGTQGGRDLADMIEYVGTRDWCSGKVTMSGNSQTATWQWMAAQEQPPHLAAIAPWEGWSDFYREIMCAGGIPEVGVRGSRGWCGNGVEDVVAMIHKYPLMNEYWEDKIVRMDKIKIPAYITSNYKHWHSMGSFAGFRQIETKDKWIRVINNQEWPDYYALPQMEDLKAFYDHFLKGIQNDWEKTPRVRLSILDPGGLDQINRPEKEWPLARTQYEKLYLDASAGKLSAQPVQRESQTQYAGETGQAIFTVKFDRETELTGYFKLRLWVEADAADDMDLFVYVQKLNSKGDFLPSMILGHPHPGAQGWLRVSHRELDPAKSTPAEPYLTHRRLQPLRPKEIVPVEIGIWPTGMIWHAGQQLRLIVSGHFIDTRGSDWWEPFKYESKNKGNHIIYAGGKYDSHLLVPRIPVA